MSLVSLAPEQLIALKETGTCQFDVPEWLFDLDTPGHYMRRIRMVSVTIPCVIGPFTTIHCRTQLVKSAYRQNATVPPGAQGYDRLAADDPAAPDSRFIDDRKVLEAMVTSTAQNDAGLFEPSLRDDRYLPFEGAGAISTWRLDLSRQFRTLDYDSITDVILHLRYTARDGGQALRDAAEASTANLLADAARHPLSRLFSLRHEFPAEWNRFVTTPAAQVNAMALDLAAERFPYFAEGRAITIREAKVLARSRSSQPATFAIAPGSTPPDPASPGWTGQEGPGTWTVATSADPKSIEDAFVVVAYTL